MLCIRFARLHRIASPKCDRYMRCSFNARFYRMSLGHLIGYGARAQCQQGETSVCLIEHENKNANKLFPSIEPTLMAAVSITVQPFVRRHIPQCAIQIDDDHSSVRRNERVHNTDGMELIRTRTKCKWEWNIELTAIQQNNVRFYCIIFSIANANDQMTNH